MGHVHRELEIVQPERGGLGDQDEVVASPDRFDHRAGRTRRGVDQHQVHFRDGTLDRLDHRHAQGFPHIEQPVKETDGPGFPLTEPSDLARHLGDGLLRAHQPAAPAGVTQLGKGHDPVVQADDGAEPADLAALPAKRAPVRVHPGVQVPHGDVLCEPRLEEDMAVGLFHVAVGVGHRCKTAGGHPCEVGGHGGLSRSPLAAGNRNPEQPEPLSLLYGVRAVPGSTPGQAKGPALQVDPSGPCPTLARRGGSTPGVLSRKYLTHVRDSELVNRRVHPPLRIPSRRSWTGCPSAALPDGLPAPAGSPEVPQVPVPVPTPDPTTRGHHRRTRDSGARSRVRILFRPSPHPPGTRTRVLLPARLVLHPSPTCGPRGRIPGRQSSIPGQGIRRRSRQPGLSWAPFLLVLFCLHPA